MSVSASATVSTCLAWTAVRSWSRVSAGGRSMPRETLHTPLHEATCLHHAGSLGVRPGAARAPRRHGHRSRGVRRIGLLLADSVLHPRRRDRHTRRPHPRRRRARDRRGRLHSGGARAGIPGDAAGVPGRRVRLGGLTRVSSERMIDPLERWREYGEKPDYAGLLTFSGMPYTQDPAELAGVDVAIVGAPTDDLVSDRPGTRFGPRAIRAAPSAPRRRAAPPPPRLPPPAPAGGGGPRGFRGTASGRLRRRAGHPGGPR